jgi:hypothetical protein
MNFAMQHWIALLIVAVIFFYIGRKTGLGAGLPIIG